jgi:hypothetical protein
MSLSKSPLWIPGQVKIHGTGIRFPFWTLVLDTTDLSSKAITHHSVSAGLQLSWILRMILTVLYATKARNTHLSTAANCSWYRHGKLRMPPAIATTNRQDGFQVYDLGQHPPTTDLHPEEAVDEMEKVPHPGDYEDLFHFIHTDPVRDPDIGEAGHGPSTTAHRHRQRLLDDEDDSRVESVHPTAGKVIRMKDTLHQVWRQRFKSIDGDGDVEMGDEVTGITDPNIYMPFASEMDWKIARWMVKENPGHGAFDCLLEIPGVSFS